MEVTKVNVMEKHEQNKYKTIYGLAGGHMN